jgi:hypothetical protein
MSNIPHNLAVDSTRDAVLQLQVHLGHSIFRKDRGFGDIAYGVVSGGPKHLAQVCSNAELGVSHTDSRRLDHVADGESLDSLVLGGASRAVGAADGVGVAPALLVAAVGCSLLDHGGGELEACQFLSIL